MATKADGPEKPRRSPPLFGAEPAEDGSRHERVDEAVDSGLQAGRPGAAVPDRGRPETEAVSDERGERRKMENRRERRIGGQRAAGDQARENADDDAKEKPETERFSHRWGGG